MLCYHRKAKREGGVTPNICMKNAKKGGVVVAIAVFGWLAPANKV